MAVSSKGTELQYCATSSGTFTKLFPIKGFPEMMGKKKKLDTTTNDDNQETSIDGIRSATEPEFTGNYDPTTFATCKALEGTTYYWRLVFSGTEYIAWQGKLSMGIPSKGVDETMEMTAAITTETAPEWNTAPTPSQGGTD